MGFYDRHVLPRLLDLACGVKPVRYQRQKIVPGATGRILEIGIGSGLNLPFYDAAKVDKLWGLEPSPEMTTRARAAARAVPFEVEFIDLPGEEIPLGDASVDTVLVTYALCTIADVGAALAQMRRVLRPGGRLLFCEHGRAPDAGVRRWQDRLNPAWRRIAGGCNLNRAIPELITDGGFTIDRLESMYIPGPRPVSFNYWGRAHAG